MPNPIDVVEAAYELDGDDKTWLARVASAVRPLIDGGRGVFAYYADPARAPTSWLDDVVRLDAPSEDVETARRWSKRASQAVRQVHHDPQNGGLSMARELEDKPEHFDAKFDGNFDGYMEDASTLGICDNACFMTLAPRGRGVCMLAAHTEPRSFDARTKRLWARVSAHIAAALRLREAVGADEAVLAPSGRFEHAEGEAVAKSARESLRDAVVRQESARGALRKRDPEAATEAWTALVAGRWSLVDRFERGGRRYVVARRNELALPDPRALTPRERAVAHLAGLGKPNKLVAYELGLAESTVATHLANAMRKLGVRSRVELVSVLMSSVGGA